MVGTYQNCNTDFSIAITPMTAYTHTLTCRSLKQLANEENRQTNKIDETTSGGGLGAVVALYYM